MDPSFNRPQWAIENAADFFVAQMLIVKKQKRLSIFVSQRVERRSTSSAKCFAAAKSGRSSGSSATSPCDLGRLTRRAISVRQRFPAIARSHGSNGRWRSQPPSPRRRGQTFPAPCPRRPGDAPASENTAQTPDPDTARQAPSRPIHRPRDTCQQARATRRAMSNLSARHSKQVRTKGSI